MRAPSSLFTGYFVVAFSYVVDGNQYDGENRNPAAASEVTAEVQLPSLPRVARKFAQRKPVMESMNVTLRPCGLA